VKALSTTSILGIALALAVLLPLTAAAETKKCPRFEKKKPFVYAIGSSTMGSYLGSYLEQDLPKAGFAFRKWAKASSGLARPDFHDWISKVPDIAKQWKPDIFVVSLGTNDFQPLRKGKRWIKLGTREWTAEYTARVDKMIQLASGKGNKRVVVWVGPGIFDQPKARRMAMRINAIVKARIEAFNGPAFHVDLVTPLVGKGKRPAKTIRVSSRRRVAVFGKDGIHMSREAINHLMAKPVIRLLTACKEGKAVTQR
jgi:hypothetical protein